MQLRSLSYKEHSFAPYRDTQKAALMNADFYLVSNIWSVTFSRMILFLQC